MLSSWQNKINSLIIRGCEFDIITHVIDNDNAENTINLFTYAATYDPDFLLDEVNAPPSKDGGFLMIQRIHPDPPEASRACLD